MKNQVLSIEQIQHLKKIGVDTSKASAVILFLDEDNACVGWDVEDHGKESQLYEVYDEDSEIWMPCRMEIMDAETGNYDHSFRDECGTFTLQDMFELIPSTIIVTDERLKDHCDYYDEENHTVEGQLNIDFLFKSISYDVYGYEGRDLSIPYKVETIEIIREEFWHDISNDPIQGNTLLESCYLMLCWLAENGYLNKSDKQ